MRAVPSCCPIPTSGASDIPPARTNSAKQCKVLSSNRIVVRPSVVASCLAAMLPGNLSSTPVLLPCRHA
eukprot:2920570-Prorocentrum_lima.AAC.1